MLTFCFHEIDALVQDGDELLNICYRQLYSLENSLPKDRSIDGISEEFSYTFTCIYISESCHSASVLLHGEEILIIYLARLTTGDPWMRLIPGNFGGDIRRETYMLLDDSLNTSFIKFLEVQLVQLRVGFMKFIHSNKLF